ncbi:exodeoxyribonuclease V subunit gamma, partial [Peribacillus butanolivorans]|uniref:exodeoxyribonuclease V subunit gamma n=1 Tax=Peribacillus butanolivorans TaxID=421767 RepID=UPI0036DB5BA4
MSQHESITPGFMVIHGNRSDDLRNLVVEWMRLYPLRPLENEVVLVQSNGIAQWLKMALAADSDDGGCGVAAAIDVQLPGSYLWLLYRSV